MALDMAHEALSRGEHDEHDAAAPAAEGAGRDGGGECEAEQLAQEHRKLQERLEDARSNLRFTEKRIADLEAQLLETEGGRL